MIYNQGELIKLVENTNKKLNEMGSGWEGPQGEKGPKCSDCDDKGHYSNRYGTSFVCDCDDKGHYSNRYGTSFVCDCDAGKDVSKATGIQAGEKMPEHTGSMEEDMKLKEFNPTNLSLRMLAKRKLKSKLAGEVADIGKEKITVEDSKE